MHQADFFITIYAVRMWRVFAQNGCTLWQTRKLHNKSSHDYIQPLDRGAVYSFFVLY